ncbi:MAG: helix-turn-helix domain-containing protein [Streptosporangiaceae bacterium]
MSIGDALAGARRQAGLTTTQVSQRTCIRETIVRGIERGDYSACGGDFYARGHIRSIARTVGLDPDELIREYDATQAPPQPITAADVFQPFTPVRLKERRRRPNWTVLLVIGLLVVLGIAGFRYFGSSHHSSPPASAGTRHTPKPKATHKVVPVVYNRLVLTMRAYPGQYSWVQLSSTAGQLIFQGYVYPNTPKTWTERQKVLVVIGNPAALTMTVNGRTHSHLGTTVLRLTCDIGGCQKG